MKKILVFNSSQLISLKNSFYIVENEKSHFYDIEDNQVMCKKTKPYKIEWILNDGTELRVKDNVYEVYNSLGILENRFDKSIVGYDRLNDNSTFIFADEKRSIYDKKGNIIFQLPFDRKSHRFSFHPFVNRIILSDDNFGQINIYDIRFMSSPICFRSGYTEYNYNDYGFILVYDNLLTYTLWNFGLVSTVELKDTPLCTRPFENFIDIFTINTDRYRYQIS